jgi:hypothetical protein
MRLSVSRTHGLLTFREGAGKDSSHAFPIDVERKECQWYSAWVSPLVHKTERASAELSALAMSVNTCKADLAPDGQQQAADSK